MNKTSKIITASAIALALATFVPIFAQAAFVPSLGPTTPDIATTTPTTVGSNNAEVGTTTIPSNSGSNGSEGGTTLVPTNGGSNSAEGGTTLVPTFGGSNGNENVISTTTPPVITSIDDISVTTDSSAGIVVTFTSPTATNAGGNSIPVICTPSSGSMFPVGTTPVTCTATDASNNTATTTFNVIVTKSNTSSVSQVSGGGGSGGSYYSGGSSGGGFIGNSLFSSTTPNITATSTLSCPFLTGYVIPGRTNIPADISKLQLFLNLYNNSHLTINGILDQPTINAVKSFQTVYLTDIMGPWGANVASGQTYITTLKKINNLVCNSSKILTPAELAIINAYKAQFAQNELVTTPASTASTASTTSGNPVVGTTEATSSASTTSPGIINNNASLVGNVFGAVGNFFGSILSKIKSWF